MDGSLNVSVVLCAFFYVRVMCGCQFERECGAVCIFLCEGDV